MRREPVLGAGAMSRTTKTMTVSLPPAMMDEVDRLCAEEHRTRSELVREAFRLYFATSSARRVATTGPQARRRRSATDE